MTNIIKSIHCINFIVYASQAVDAKLVKCKFLSLDAKYITGRNAKAVLSKQYNLASDVVSPWGF